MIGCFGIIAALYLIVSVAVQYVLPADAIAQSTSPMSTTVTHSVLGLSGALVVATGIVVSLLTSLNGVAMSGARMTFAVSRDGNFFPRLARIHPRFHTPHIATIFQAILSIVCLSFGGSFGQLFKLALFAEWLSYVAASVALFVFRARKDALETGTKTWQFPLAPALFILASAALLYYTFSSNLRYSIVGSLVILAGIPMYYLFALRRRV
jgi:APA family basic amino acid/polyamine antiporter